MPHVHPFRVHIQYGKNRKPKQEIRKKVKRNTRLDMSARLHLYKKNQERQANSQKFLPKTVSVGILKIPQSP